MLLMKFDEETSKQELLAVIDEMAALDKNYPMLGTPSKIREMLNDGIFDVDERPWDFLVALGYSTIRLCEEIDECNREVSNLLRRVDRVLKHPMKWMYDAITPEVQSRYHKMAGITLPCAVVTRHMPRSLKGKCEIFAWHEYGQLQYVLGRIRSAPYIIELPKSDDRDKLYGIMSVHELRDWIASMERPPRDILEEFTQHAINVELEALQKDLDRAQRKADALAFLGYTVPKRGVHAVEKLAETLGIKL